MRVLNSRQKLFLRSMVDHGFFDALKIAKYSKRQGYRILNDPKAETYLVSIVKNTLNQLGITYAELLQKRLELAEDPETPARVRSDILKDLCELIEKTESGAEDNSDPNTRLFNGKHLLKPSKTIGVENN